MRKEIVLRFASFMIINIMIAIGLYVISVPLWSRPIIAIGFESLAAVLSSLCLAAVAFQYKNDPKKSYVLIALAVTYFTSIELGGAIEKQLIFISPIVQKTPFVLSSDLLSILVVFIMIFSGVLLEVKKPNEVPDRAFNIKALSMIVLIFILHGLARLWILPVLSQGSITQVSLVFQLMIFIVLLGICYILITKHRLFQQMSTLRTIGFLLMFYIAASCSLLAILTNTTIWILSNCFQIVALFNFYIGISVPILKRFDKSEKRNSDTFANSLAGVIVLLLFITLVTELIWSTIYHYDLGIATFARISSTILSITISLFTLRYARSTEKQFMYPLLFIYGTWIAMGVSQLLFSLFATFSQTESMVYFITASLLSIPAFGLSIIWLQDDKKVWSKLSAHSWLYAGLLTAGVLMLVGETIRTIILGNGIWDPSSIGRSLLLLLCLISMSQLTFISYTLFKRNHGLLKLDSVSVALLSLWIIPGLLKGNFETWTIGWWVSEGVLMAGLFIAPLILGFMYLDSSILAQKAETRAKVYADLLAHDISNHHQIIINSIELVLMESTPDYVKDRTLKDAYNTLIDADRLVRNVRKLGSLEVLSKRDLEVFDLTSTISSTIRLIGLFDPNRSIDIEFQHPDTPCEILANDLLPDIFMNLILNAIEYSGGEKVEITISDDMDNPESSWVVSVADYGPGIHPNQRASLFTRYMKGAKGSGIGLSLVRALTEFFEGSIHVEDRIPGQYEKGSRFVLTFPKCKS